MVMVLYHTTVPYRVVRVYFVRVKLADAIARWFFLNNAFSFTCTYYNRVSFEPFRSEAGHPFALVRYCKVDQRLARFSVQNRPEQKQQCPTMSDEEEADPDDDTPSCNRIRASHRSNSRDTAYSAGPEIVAHDDDDARTSAPFPPVAPATDKKETRDGDSLASRSYDVFLRASVDSLENGGRLSSHRSDDDENDGKEDPESTSPSREVVADIDVDDRGSEETRMDVVRMPPPTRQNSPMPHVPTAFLVPERPSGMIIYDAILVFNEPWWKKNRLAVAATLLALSAVGLVAALLLRNDAGATDAVVVPPPDDGPIPPGRPPDHFAVDLAVDPSTAAPFAPSFVPHPTASPSSSPSSCDEPLTFHRALLSKEDACDDECGVQIAAGDDRAVATVGNRVWFYRRTDSGWERRPEAFRLDANGLRPAISKSGSVAAVGAYREMDRGGTVHVFERGDDDDDDGENSAWRRSASLVPMTDVLGDDDRFGISVDMDDDRILVGARGRPGGGAAYLFRRRHDGNWSQEAEFYPRHSNPEGFGSTVALAGNTLAVADVFDSTVFVYAYDESSEVWDLRQNISLSDCDEHFGRSIALREEGIAIGCDWDDDAAGAVYYYELSASSFPVGEYVLKQKLIASDRAQNNSFGSSNSIRMERNIMTVGSFTAPNGSNSGSAYIFARRGPGDFWTQIANISSPDEKEGDRFGAWIALAGRHILVASMTNAYSYELKDCQAL
ncbi:hypothetical protein ACHAW6_003059 [Cyclotella cf. meneghiniana]